MSDILGVRIKAPTDRRDADISFEDWMPDGDSLASATAEADDDGITVESATVYGDVVKVWISGGEDGGSYKIIVQGTTDEGRKKTACIQVRVRDC